MDTKSDMFEGKQGRGREGPVQGQMGLSKKRLARTQDASGGEKPPNGPGGFAGKTQGNEKSAEKLTLGQTGGV